MNALEPASLAEAFRIHPPEGFNAFTVSTAAGEAPAFFAKFDVLTTLEDEHRWIIDRLAQLRLGWLTRFPTVFSGTTVTEYSTYPELDLHPDGSTVLVDRLVEAANTLKARLLIIKDLPCGSPLLSERENQVADGIIRACTAAGFVLVDGQALAYVPIDFSTIDEFIGRAGKSRRRDLRRKLRSRDDIDIEPVSTGRAFDDEKYLATLYKQYLNVFNQSKYHFDILSPEFFKEILTDDTNGGVVFLYRKANRLIGYNICFQYDGKLVDKYVGFEYPAAREANLYFVSWFHNLEYALTHGLSHYIAGWTDPEVKAALGASFTTTRHAVYARNPVLRKMVGALKRFFENDSDWTGSGAHQGGGNA